jgi:hypothetical protein
VLIVDLVSVVDRRNVIKKYSGVVVVNAKGPLLVSLCDDSCKSVHNVTVEDFEANRLQMFNEMWRTQSDFPVSTDLLLPAAIYALVQEICDGYKVIAIVEDAGEDSILIALYRDKPIGAFERN